MSERTKMILAVVAVLVFVGSAVRTWRQLHAVPETPPARPGGTKPVATAPPTPAPVATLPALVIPGQTGPGQPPAIPVTWRQVQEALQKGFGKDPFTAALEAGAATSPSATATRPGTTPATTGTQAGPSRTREPDLSLPAPIRGLRLEGISRGMKRFLAIINDGVVEVGDEIAGFRVISIGEKGVYLEKGGETYLLPLPAAPNVRTLIVAPARPEAAPKSPAPTAPEKKAEEAPKDAETRDAGDAPPSNDPNAHTEEK